MIKEFIKKYILLLSLSVLFLGALIVSDFILDRSYLKLGTVLLWFVDAGCAMFFLSRIERVVIIEKMIAKQCESCNLFVPLGDDNNTPLPHCCYLKPAKPKGV